MSFVRAGPRGPAPKSFRNPRRERLIAGTLLALLLAARLADLSALATLRLWTFDLAAYLRPQATKPAAAAVVQIDDASLLAAGQWPWPRDLLASLVEAIARVGASVVVLDLVLSEPDRMPAADPARAARHGGNDALLAEALQAVPAVTASALSGVALPAARDDAPPAGRFAVVGSLDTASLPGAEAAVRPLRGFETASRGTGITNLMPDSDAAVRSVPGMAVVAGGLLPGLALEASRVAVGAGSMGVDVAAPEGLTGIRVGGLFVPTDMRGRIRVDLRDPGRVPVVAAHRLLSGESPGALAGRVVVVGASAAGLGVPVRMPGGAIVTHAAFQALAVDTILGGRVLARPAFLRSLEIAATTLVGLALLILGPRLGLPALGRCAVFLAVALPATSAAAVASAGVLIDTGLPLLTGLILLAQFSLSRLHEEAALRRRHEAQLASQDAYMRQVVDASFDAIVTIDRAARIVTANAGAGQLFGLPPEVLVGAPIHDFLGGSWAEALRQAPEAALRRAILGRQIIPASVDRGEGRPAPVEMTVAETATEDRTFVIVLRDIAARLDAETAARRSAERLRDGIARITDGFARFGPDRRLIICNARFVEMLGEAGSFARDGERFETIMRQYAGTARAPLDARGRGDAWVEERRAAFRQDSETRIQQTADGRWFRIDERPTAEGGLVGVYSDITELKWHEIEMGDAVLRAEAASSAKSEFLANMSHELRTPLNAVIGFADLMKRELLGPLGNDQYRSYVADIIASGTKLLSMIEAILEFSRSEHSSLQDPESPSDLNDVARAVLRDLRPAALARDVVLSVELGAIIPPVTIDGAVLYQILQNLVSNAIKFSKPGGPVSVATFLDGDGRPGLRVADRGAGVPPELIDKVTQPFWQRQGPLVRDHDGVGLGLAIVKSHLDALEGELRFVSRVDEGTTVTVLFPARLARSG